jgi:ATP-dependent RNA helicase DeaD
MSTDTTPEFAEETASNPFAALGLDDRLVAALTALGFETPTPIQAQAIPPLLEGGDVLGQAATGTGKTAAFGLPLLHRIMQDAGRSRDPRAVILVPTRELAIQVATALEGFARGAGLKVVAVYGGQPISAQLYAIRRGVDVVVATPGRLIDHLERRSLRLEGVQTVVLDEADEMLDMGFAEDLDAIFGALPETRQTALFSATLPQRIAQLAATHLTEPTRIRVKAEKPAAGDAPRVQQRAYIVPGQHKVAALERLLNMDEPASSIIFCRTRRDVDTLSAALARSGQRCEALHGGISQDSRDRVMARFRDGDVTLLIATDVAARGLDIDHVSHVINFDMPQATEVYVHRIGRTGRAGREGVAITLVKPNERRQLQAIERVAGSRIGIEKLPSGAALQTRRRERALAMVRRVHVEGNTEAFRAEAEALAAELTPAQLAAAALALAQQQVPGRDDASDIPCLAAQREREPRQRQEAPRNGERRNGRRDRQGGWEVASLYVSVGREGGIRPSDLVGAIANELDLSARAIGSIQIGPHFSLVEVPEEIADDIVAGMRGATIKGKRVTIRRDRDVRPC